jgi:hypothetical protein
LAGHIELSAGALALCTPLNQPLAECDVMVAARGLAALLSDPSEANIIG